MPDIALRTGTSELRARRDAADYDVWLRVVPANDGPRAYRQPLRLVPVVAAAPATGTLAVTLADLTCVGTGTVQVTGTLAATLGALTLSGSGTVAVTGALAATLADVTCSGSGTVRVTGALAVTLDSVTLAATGTVRVSGALAATLAALTCSGWVSIDRLDRTYVVPAYGRAAEVALDVRAVDVSRPEVGRDMFVQLSSRAMSVADSPRASTVTD